MSAREKILRYVKENQSSIDPPCDPETGFFVEDPEAHVSGLLDAYAHELAEEIRAENRKRYLGAHGAANLIDPKVSDG